MLHKKGFAQASVHTFIYWGCVEYDYTAGFPLDVCKQLYVGIRSLTKDGAEAAKLRSWSENWVLDSGNWERSI